MNTFVCTVCKTKKEIQKSGGTGYAVDDKDRKICYACCGVQDREHMKEHGRIVLYLVGEKGKTEVTNWPGTLRFRAGYVKEGRHNIAGTRRDTWFKGPDGYTWHGVQYGQWSDICRCKRTKQKA